MNCPKCQAQMFEDHFGFPRNTVEVWRCSNPGCDYTFEMRTSTRGFSYRFEGEPSRPGRARPVFWDNGWGFPHQVFDQAAGAPQKKEGS